VPPVRPAPRRPKAKAATALEQPLDGQPAQLLAEAIGRGHDHTAQLHERLAADVDGAATRDQQQPQRLSPLAHPRQRERVAGECRPRRPDRVECVVLAAQPTLAPRCPAELAHRFALLGERAGQTGAVAACALDRPDAPARGVALRETEHLPVTAPVRSNRPSGHDSARRRCQHGQHVLVPMGVDADHVIHLICNHPDRSSGFCS
jgi:hypothetical protein